MGKTQFTKDESNATLTIERSFPAAPDRIWRANAVASLPRQEISMSLVAQGDATKVVSLIRYASLTDMNTILEMGMQEGLTIAQDQLEALLESGTV